MKRTPLLLTLVVLIVLAGGYYLYEKVYLKEPLKAWDLVPSRTIFVYEKDVCASCIDEMHESPIGQLLSRAAFHSQPMDSLRRMLDEVLASSENMLVSAHVTRKDDFDFIYYLSGGNQLANALVRIPSIKGYRYSERQLSDVKIHELNFNRQTFSWIQLDKVFVGSFTPFLIEDVIRTYKGKTNFIRTNPEVRRLPRINGDAGNLYVQLRNLSDLFSVFIPPSGKSYALAKSSLLDIKSMDGNLVLNGFSVDSLAYPDYLLSIFRDQSPVSFGLRNHVPNRTLLFTDYGVNDGRTFATALERFVKTHKPDVRDSLNRLSSGLGFGWDELYGTISNEIGICQMEAVEGQGIARVVMIETKTPELWIKHLNAVSEKFSTDTVFHERFSDYVIREIPVRGFPGKLLWPLVQEFGYTYYTARGNTILMGDNLEELKFFLEDLEQEDIWGKSVSKNQFLESTLLESNVSVFINTPRIWNAIIPRLHPRWRQFVQDNHPLLQAVQMSAFQFSHLNNTYYTNITINQGEARPDIAFTSSARRNMVHFSEPIQRLHAVKSHVSRSDEILVQDSLNDLSLVSMDGKVLWKLPIGDPITSEIHQVDFYRNGKLQYLFATRDAIHIIDRLGNYVPPYPLHLPGKDIQHLSVLDYDRSKRYRFLISEYDGKLWMFDKSGKNLEGWTPRDAGGELMAPPMHHRIKGRDFILAIRKDGWVQLYNRRGESMKNFPLNIQGTPMGDYFLETGQDIASSYFVVVTRDGYRVRFDPEGKIQNRETLLRASVTSQFGLKTEKSGKSYLIWQHDSRQLTVTDPSGKKILVNDYISLKNWDMQFYHFGGGKRFITLTDGVQELSYVFDASGNLVTSPPLESTAIELRTVSSDQSYVFFIHDRTLTIQPLNP